MSLTITEGDTSIATLKKTTNEHTKTGLTGAHDNYIERVAAKVAPFIWRLLTMPLAMGAGIAFFHLLILLIRASSSYAALFEPGTDLYSIGMAIFMTVPTWLASQCGMADALLALIVADHPRLQIADNHLPHLV